MPFGERVADRLGKLSVSLASPRNFVSVASQAQDQVAIPSERKNADGTVVARALVTVAIVVVRHDLHFNGYSLRVAVVLGHG
jgi:hypothetical protein